VRAQPMVSLGMEEGTALLRLDGPDRDTVKALLSFVAFGLAHRSNLDQIEAIALNEIERARKAAAKKSNASGGSFRSRLPNRPRRHPFLAVGSAIKNAFAPFPKLNGDFL
jgi:hypothetical protein